MKLSLYPKLAWDSIRKNKRLYLPYLLTCAGMVMMYYIISFLTASPTLEDMRGGRNVQEIMIFGCWIVALFALIFLFYTNSFLMRRRDREFGLYNILGMGKRDLGLLLLWETVLLYAISMAAGLFFGIVLSKLAQLGLAWVVSGQISYDLSVAPAALLDALWIFALIFGAIFLKNLVKLWRRNTVSLLRSESVGEKPPRANLLLGLGGVVLLAGAYYIAVSIESPLAALGWFFVAVIMVIVATYMLFISGSVLLCRLLQKNKRFYYQKAHFVSVSSMAYRMKRNGAGLASICILSTMVLVMMMGAGSLYFGMESSLEARCPHQVSVSVDFPSKGAEYVYTPEKEALILDELEAVLESQGTEPEVLEHYLSASVTGMLRDGQLTADPSDPLANLILADRPCLAA